MHSAILPYFDFDWWTKILIDPRKDQFAPVQLHRVRELMPGYIAHLYHQRFSDGLNRQPTVHEVRKVRRDYLVTSSFKRRGARDLPVDWRLREVPGEGSQVIDMMVGGTSFLILKREEFHAIIDKSGAEGILTFLREKSR